MLSCSVSNAYTSTIMNVKGAARINPKCSITPHAAASSPLPPTSHPDGRQDEQLLFHLARLAERHVLQPREGQHRLPQQLRLHQRVVVLHGEDQVRVAGHQPLPVHVAAAENWEGQRRIMMLCKEQV